MTESKPINGFVRVSVTDRLDREINNLETLLYLPENEWNDEVKNLRDYLNSTAFKIMGMDREYLFHFLVTRISGWSMAKIKKYRLPENKNKKEARNEEIVIWCDIYLSQDMKKKDDEGGVYHEVGKLFGLSGTTIRGIYKKAKNNIRY